jgi:hypothetical protein
VTETERRSATRNKRAMDLEVQRYLRTGEQDHSFAGWPARTV